MHFSRAEATPDRVLFKRVGRQTPNPKSAFPKRRGVSRARQSLLVQRRGSPAALKGGRVLGGWCRHKGLRNAALPPWHEQQQQVCCKLCCTLSCAATCRCCCAPLLQAPTARAGDEFEARSLCWSLLECRSAPLIVSLPTTFLPNQAPCPQAPCPKASKAVGRT